MCVCVCVCVEGVVEFYFIILIPSLKLFSCLYTALPSPNFPGAFLFPPTTPTGQLIAPISLPGELGAFSILGTPIHTLTHSYYPHIIFSDLSNTGSDTITVTSSSSTAVAVSEHQEPISVEPPPAKRPREDGRSSVSPNPPQAHQ